MSNFNMLSKFEFSCKYLSQVSHFTMNSGKTITCVNRYMKKDHGRKLSFEKGPILDKKHMIADIVTKGFPNPKVQKYRRGLIMKKNYMMIAELNLHVTSVHEGRKLFI